MICSELNGLGNGEIWACISASFSLVVEAHILYNSALSWRRLMEEKDHLYTWIVSSLREAYSRHAKKFLFLYFVVLHKKLISSSSAYFFFFADMVILIMYYCTVYSENRPSTRLFCAAKGIPITFFLAISIVETWDIYFSNPWTALFPVLPLISSLFLAHGISWWV